jgi:hypothetical protein
MKKVIRVLAMVLCVVMLASAFYGCTVKININVDGAVAQAPAVQQVPATQAPTAAPTQAPTAAPTQAPATTAAPADTTAAPAGTTAAPADTTAAPADTTAAPADTTAAPADKAPSTVEEVLAEYAVVYKTTKASGTFKGHDTMSCEYVKIDGKDNSMVKGIADGFVKATGTNMDLPPYKGDDNPMESLLTAADVDSATYTDNGDGTATIKIVPKAVENAKFKADPQGKAFNVMEDIAGALDGISVITWAEGDANSNVKLTEKDGYIEVVYNKDTKMMTKADYVLVTYADVTHANVAILKDKSASVKFVYTMTYPG